MPTRQFSGARLRAEREARGVLAEAVAVALFPLPYSILAVELGVVVPSRPMVARMAAVIGCEVSDLYEEATTDAA